MKNRLNDLGASLLEIILALGIMAILTPVAMKLVFKDLSEVKYLNLAKQMKQLEKSVAAFASTKRSDLVVGSANIEKTADFQNLGLADSIDSNIYENLSMRYKKSADKTLDNGNKISGELVFYAVVDMANFGLTLDTFKKTLLYAGENWGYAISGEKCGECTSDSCVCNITGDWGVNFSDVSDKTVNNDSQIAVLRIDDTLLEKEYASEYYLYRNSQGSNVMERNLYLGEGSDVNNWYDIKNIKEITLNTLWGQAENQYLKKVKADSLELIADKITILSNIILSKELSVSTKKYILVPIVNFLVKTNISYFSFPNAVLKVDNSNSGYRPTVFANKTVFEKVEVQNMKFSKPISSSTAGDLAGTVSINEGDDTSKLKVELPNLTSNNLITRIINVNNKELKTSDAKIYTAKGKLMLSNNIPINIHNIHGSTPSVNLFNVMSTFTERINAINPYDVSGL